MSGGVDFSVTAALLDEQGYDVVGITLQLYDHGPLSAARARVARARTFMTRAASPSTIGIPHYVLDYENLFRDVVIGFRRCYLRGETPIPCVAAMRK